MIDIVSRRLLAGAQETGRMLFFEPRWEVRVAVSWLGDLGTHITRVKRRRIMGM
jgi:hypothetical protein